MIHTLSTFLIGVLLFILGYPLAKRKIKRNHFYGYRISKAVMTYDHIWYKVNEVGGKHMLLIGLTTSLLSLVGFLVEEASILFSTLALIAMFLGIIISWIKCLRISNEMKRSKNL